MTVALIYDGDVGVEIDALLDFENGVGIEEVESTVRSIKESCDYSYDFDMLIEGLEETFGSRLEGIYVPNYDYSIYW